MSDLDERKIGYLLAIGDVAPHWWSASSREEFIASAMPLAELEWAHLIEGSGGLLRLTERGRQAVARLRGAGR